MVVNELLGRFIIITCMWILIALIGGNLVGRESSQTTKSWAICIAASSGAGGWIHLMVLVGLITIITTSVAFLILTGTVVTAGAIGPTLWIRRKIRNGARPARPAGPAGAQIA